jgi:hypothetical protein
MIKALVGLVVLLVVALAADRVGVEYAEQRVATQLQEELALSAPPGVEINGFPVLTQAVAGRYDDVRLTLSEADLGELSGLDVVVGLEGLHLPLSELFSENVEAVPVDRVEGTVSVPYAEVAAQIGEGVAVANGPDGVVVTQTLEVLGQDVEVSGTGQLLVAGPDEIGVTVVGLSLAGVEIPDFLIEQLQDQLSFVYIVPPLPFGLQITEVVATDGGFDISAAAEDTVLEPI